MLNHRLNRTEETVIPDKGVLSSICLRGQRRSRLSYLGDSANTYIRSLDKSKTRTKTIHEQVEEERNKTENPKLRTVTTLTKLEFKGVRISRSGVETTKPRRVY